VRKRRGVTLVFCLMAAPSASWTSWFFFWPETKAKCKCHYFNPKKMLKEKKMLIPPLSAESRCKWRKWWVELGGNACVVHLLMHRQYRCLSFVKSRYAIKMRRTKSAGSRNKFTAFTDPLSSCICSAEIWIFFYIKLNTILPFCVQIEWCRSSGQWQCCRFV